MIISNGKVLHFFRQMFNTNVFEQKFLNNWEDSRPINWGLTVTYFCNELDKIG